MYRLHIDIPLGPNENDAIQQVEDLMHWHFADPEAKDKIKYLMGNVNQINYRLGHDEDRQKSNYLNKTENGHVTNKKSRIDFDVSVEDSSEDPSQGRFGWVNDMLNGLENKI